MFQNLINKSLSVLSPDKSPQKTKTSSPKEISSQNETQKKICSLCKGAGCCVLCDRPDDWENMMYCSNRRERVHLLHHSCDNLSKELLRPIVKYYCPSCRLNPKNKITFKKDTSAAKRAEILDILIGSKPENPTLPEVIDQLGDTTSDVQKPNAEKNDENLVNESVTIVKCGGEDGKSQSEGGGGSDLDSLSSSSDSSFNSFRNKLSSTSNFHISEQDSLRHDEVTPKNNDEADDEKSKSLSESGGEVELDNSSSSDSSFNSFTEKIAASSFPVSDKVNFKVNSPSNKSNINEPDDVEKSEIIKGTISLFVGGRGSDQDDSTPLESSFPDEKRGSKGNKSSLEIKNGENGHEKSSSDFHEPLYDSFRQEFPGQKHATTPLTIQSQKSSTFFSTSLYVPHNNSQTFKNTSPTRRHSFSVMPHLTQNEHDREELANSTKNNEKLVELVNVLTNKLSEQNKENQTLKQQINKLTISPHRLNFKIMELKSENEELNKENENLQLQLDEAITQINILETNLENTEDKLKIMDSQLIEIQKSHEIGPNEMFRYPPHEFHELYIKQINMTKKLQSQISQLLGDKRNLKNEIAELKATNEEYRLQVRNLIEEDIDRGILNYTINENKRLLNKIKIQKERHINLGLELKNEMKKMHGWSIENVKLRKKLAAYEKNDKQKNESVIVAEDFPEEDWETTSEQSVVVNPLLMSSPPNSTKKDDKISVSTNTSPTIQNNEKNSTSNTQTSKNSEKPTEIKQICKFHMQNRCHFGFRCRNLHPEKQKSENNIFPWVTVPSRPRSHIVPLMSHQNTDLRRFDPFFTPNRFQSLSSAECLGAKSDGYWSMPYNSEINVNHFPEQTVNVVRSPY